MKIKFYFIPLLLTGFLSGAGAADDPQDGTEEGSTVPQTFNCGHNSMEWMRNCEEVNKSLHKRSNEKIRITTPEGVELFFAPDTPTTWIKLVVERTPEAAREHAEWEERSWKVQEAAQKLLVEEYKRRGRRGIPTSEDYSPEDYADEIDYKNIRVFVFTDSKCRFCKRQYPVLELLRSNYPKLDLTILQIDKDSEAFNTIKAQFDLDGYILTDSQYKKYKKIFQGQTPTILFENRDNKVRHIRHGYRNYRQIIEDLALVSGVKQ